MLTHSYLFLSGVAAPGRRSMSRALIETRFACSIALRAEFRIAIVDMDLTLLWMCDIYYLSFEITKINSLRTNITFHDQIERK